MGDLNYSSQKKVFRSFSYIFVFLFLFSLASVSAVSVKLYPIDNLTYEAGADYYDYVLDEYYLDSSENGGYAGMNDGAAAGSWDVQRMYQKYDTSSIPNTAIIDSIVFHYWVNDVYLDYCSAEYIEFYEQSLNNPSFTSLGSETFYNSEWITLSTADDWFSTTFPSTARNDFKGEMLSDDIFSFAMTSNENHYEEDCAIRISNEDVSPYENTYLIVEYTPDPSVNFAGNLPAVNLNFSEFTTINLNNYVSSNYVSSYDDFTRLVFYNPDNDQQVIVLDGNSHTNSFFTVALSNNIITYTAKTSSISSFEIQVDLMRSTQVVDDSQYFYSSIDTGATYTNPPFFTYSVPDIVITPNSAEVLDLTYYVSDYAWYGSANYSKRFYFAAGSQAYYIDDLYTNSVQVGSEVKDSFTVEIGQNNKMYIYSDTEFVDSIMPIYIYSCNEYGCVSDVFNVKTSASSSYLSVNGSGIERSMAQNPFSTIAESFTGIFPPESELTSSAKASYVVITMLAIAILFFMGIFFSHIPYSVVLTPILMTLLGGALIFFVSIGYIGMTWLIAGILVIVLTILAKIKSGI